MPTFEEIAGGSTTQKKKRTFEDIASGKGLTFEEIAASDGGGGEVVTPLTKPEDRFFKDGMSPDLLHTAAAASRAHQLSVEGERLKTVEDSMLSMGKLFAGVRHVMPLVPTETAPNPTYGQHPVLRLASELPGAFTEIALGQRLGGLPGVAAVGGVQTMLNRGREQRIQEARQTGVDPGVVKPMVEVSKQPSAWGEAAVNAALNAGTMGAAGAATKGLATKMLKNPIAGAATDQAALDAMGPNALKFMGANIAAQGGIDTADAIVRSTAAHLTRGEELSPETVGKIASDVPMYLAPSIAMSTISGLGVAKTTQANALRERAAKQSPPPEPPAPAAPVVRPDPPTPSDGVPLPRLEPGDVAPVEPFVSPDQPIPLAPPVEPRIVNGEIDLGIPTRPAPVEQDLSGAIPLARGKGKKARQPEPINALQQEPGPVVMEAPLATPKVATETPQEPTVDVKTAVEASPSGRLQDKYWDMKGDELWAAHDAERAYERRMETEALGGEQAAKEWRKLYKQSNSLNIDVADAASKKLAEIESGFTEEQNRKIFGIGESGPNADSLKELASQVSKVEENSFDATDLARSLAKVMNDLRTPEVDMATTDWTEKGGMAILNAITRRADELGIDHREIMRRAIELKVQVEGYKTHDAAEVFAPWIKFFVDKTNSSALPMARPAKQIGTTPEISPAEAIQTPTAQEPVPMAKAPQEPALPPPDGFVPAVKTDVPFAITPEGKIHPSVLADIDAKVRQYQDIAAQNPRPVYPEIEMPKLDAASEQMPADVRERTLANPPTEAGFRLFRGGVEIAPQEPAPPPVIPTKKARGKKQPIPPKEAPNVLQEKGQEAPAVAPIPMRGKFGKKTSGMARNPLGGIAEMAADYLKSGTDAKMRAWAEDVLAQARTMPTGKRPVRAYVEGGKKAAMVMSGKSPEAAIRSLEQQSASGQIPQWDKNRAGGINPKVSGLSREQFALETDAYLNNPSYKALVDKYRGVPHKWVDVSAEAEKIPLDEMRAFNPDKHAITDTKVHALENWSVGISKELEAARAEYESTRTPEARAKMDELGALNSEFILKARVARSSLGKALNSLQMDKEGFSLNPQTGSLKAKITYLDKIVADRVIEIAGPNARLDDLIPVVDKIAGAGSPEDVYRALRNYQRQKKTLGQFANQFWITNVLSGYNTQAINTLNTAFHSEIMEPFADVLAVGLSKVPGLRGKYNRAGADLWRGLKAHYTSGAMAGLTKAAQIISRGYTDDMLDAFALPKTAEFIGGWKNPFNAPGRLLSASDAVFRTMAFEGKMTEISARQARSNGKAQGLSGRKLEDYINANIDDVRTNATDDMIEEAMRHAKEMTYQTEYKDTRFGKPIGNIHGLQQESIAGVQPGVFIMPFVKTLYNIMRRSAHYSPIGLARLRNADRYSRDRVIAEAIVGGLAMGVGFMAQRNGGYTGPMPDKRGERQDAFEAKKRPFSIEGPGGNWSTKFFGPLQPVIMAGAQIAKIAEEHAKDDTDRNYTKLVTDLTKAYFEQSFLTGPNTAIKMFTGDEHEMGAAASQMFTNIAGGFIPMSGLLRQLNRDWIDTTIRETKEPNPVWNAAEKIGSNIPFVSKQLPPKRGRWGQEVQAQPDFWVGSNRPKVDPVDEYIYKIGAKIEQPRNSVSIFNPQKGVKESVQLTAQEYSDMLSHIPPEAKEVVRTLMENERFRSLPDKVQADEVRDVVTSFAFWDKIVQAEKQIRAIQAPR